MEIPTCDCVRGLDLREQLSAIYCALYNNAGMPEDLPTCECVQGLPFSEQTAAIYSALYAGADQSDLPSPDCVKGLPIFGQGDTQLSSIFCAILAGGGGGGFPQLLSATIEADGETLTLLFSQSVTQVEAGGFTLNPSGGAAGITYSSGSGSDTLVYTIDREITEDETATITFAPPPGIILGTNSILQPFSNEPVINDSTIPPALDFLTTQGGDILTTESGSQFVVTS